MEIIREWQPYADFQHLALVMTIVDRIVFSYGVFTSAIRTDIHELKG